MVKNLPFFFYSNIREENWAMLRLPSINTHISAMALIKVFDNSIVGGEY